MRAVQRVRPAWGPTASRERGVASRGGSDLSFPGARCGEVRAEDRSTPPTLAAPLRAGEEAEKIVPLSQPGWLFARASYCTVVAMIGRNADIAGPSFASL